MPFNILVTGGAGYIGSTLVSFLLHAGHKVTVIDNFMYKQSSLNHICHEKNFTIIKGDVRIKNDILPHLKEVDIIIPLAAYVGAPLCDRDPVGATTVNYDAIMMMLTHTSNSQIILMPTTNSAYGSGNEDNFCDENSPLNPMSHYALEKVKIEQALMQHPNAISYRLATVFGMSPRMRIDLLVNDFTYRAYHDRFLVLFESHFKRNYIHVRDVARAFIHAIDNFEKMKGQIYNVGLSEANLSKKDLCLKIKEYIPDFVFFESEFNKDYDQRNYIVSNKKIEGTGFSPMYSLELGIQELLKGYRMIKNSQYGNV